MKTTGLVLAVPLLLAGCTLNTDYFGEYRGVNLLGNYNFNAAPAKWTLATSTDFMDWSLVATDPQRPTEAYRLEIYNLIPNGDFQDGATTADNQTTLPANWFTTTYAGVGITDPVEFNTVPSNVTFQEPTHTTGSRALGWSAGGAGNQLRLNLSTAVTGSAWKAIDYLFEVDLRNAGPGSEVGMFLYDNPAMSTIPSDQLYNGGNWTVATSGTANDHTTIYRVVRPFLLSTSADVRVVAWGPNSATGQHSAVIDNVRLLPRSEKLSVVATLPSLSSGTKPLLPGSKDGMYIFTVDVKNDPLAGTQNHFSPTYFTVAFEAAVKSGSRNRVFTIAVPNGGWPTWTTLSFSFGFDFVNNDADRGGSPALKISISPTVANQGDYDVGTVLVSRPTLTFNP